MKKLVGFIIILGIILMLTACASVHHAPSDESEEPQIFAARDREAPTEYSEPEGTASAEAEEEVSGIKTQNVQIALANEDSPWRYPAGWQNELLNTFTCLHKLDFVIVREADAKSRGYAKDSFEYFGDGLVIWSDGRMRDFHMVLLDLAYAHTNEEQRDLIFIPQGSFGFVEEIQPGQAFLINSYFEMGEVFPAVAITFVDENDDIRYFGVQPDWSDSEESHFLWEMEDRANELAGAKISFDRENYRPDGWEPGGPYLSAF